MKTTITLKTAIIRLEKFGYSAGRREDGKIYAFSPVEGKVQRVLTRGHESLKSAWREVFGLDYDENSVQSEDVAELIARYES